MDLEPMIDHAAYTPLFWGFLQELLERLVRQVDFRHQVQKCPRDGPPLRFAQRLGLPDEVVAVVVQRRLHFPQPHGPVLQDVHLSVEAVVAPSREVVFGETARPPSFRSALLSSPYGLR